MHTIKPEVRDSIYVHIIYLLSNLSKKDIKVIEDIKIDDLEIKEFTMLSQKSLEKDWDNKEDSIYDRFL